MRNVLGTTPLIFSVATTLAVLQPQARAQQETHLFVNGAHMNDRLGTSASISGDTVVLGAPFADSSVGDSGAAYVFVRSGSGWSLQQKLEASDPMFGDRFGKSTAIDGDIIVVGAPEDDDMASNGGSVYVFTRTGTAWTQAVELWATDPGQFEGFGEAVAIEGDRIVVGAPRDDPQQKTGAAYVFESIGGTWQQVQKLGLLSPQAQQHLGQSVALAGDWILAGAPDTDTPTIANAGAAFLFRRGPTGWVEHTPLVAAAANPTAQFGVSVDLDGTLAVVGSPGEPLGGTAYVFERSGTSWSAAGGPSAMGASAGDAFGKAVSIDGERVLVGAPFVQGSGAAFVFERNGATWSEIHRLEPSSLLAGDEFGDATALDGSFAVVGAPRDDHVAGDSGSGFVFDLTQGVTAYCFGDAATCPCGNAGASNEGCASSAGQGAALTVGGSTSVGSDDLQLVVDQLPANQLALLYMGPAQLQLPFGAGVRCVGTGGVRVHRFPLQSSGVTGSISEGPGIVATASASFGLAGQIASGQQWNFQAWFTDPGGPCASDFNFSNAVQIVFTP